MRYGEVLDDSDAHFLWSFTTSGFPIGGAFASIFISTFERQFGQRKSMFYSQVRYLQNESLQMLSVFKMASVSRLVFSLNYFIIRFFAYSAHSWFPSQKQ